LTRLIEVQQRHPFLALYSNLDKKNVSGTTPTHYSKKYLNNPGQANFS
jgi:hypothetical protein